MRTLLLFGAAAAFVLASVVASFGRSIESRSPLLWGAAISLATAGGGLLALGCASRQRLNALAAAVQRMLLRCTVSAVESGHGRAGRLLVATGFAAAGIGAAISMRTADSPRDDDQGAYLSTAREVAQQGGPFALLQSLASGEFREANRHPLYLALLAMRPVEQFGRWLSIAAGAMTLWVGTAWAVRRCGWLSAGLFAIFVGTNASVIFHATRVYSEALLMLVSLCGWIALSPLFVTADAARTVRGAGGMRAFAGGCLLGLAWLTKATGLLLLVGTVLALLSHLVRQRDRIALGRVGLQSLLVLLGFMAAGSPLLIRNMRAYGNPVYNVNSQLLFVDEYRDPVQLASERATGDRAVEYFRSHTFGQLASRGAIGLVWESYILLRSLGPAPLDDGRILFGIPLFLLAVLGLSCSPHVPARLTLAWTLLLWLSFAWYVPIAAGERFLIPVLAPLLLAASEGGARLLSAASATPQQAARRGAIIGVLLAAASVVMQVAATFVILAAGRITVAPIDSAGSVPHAGMQREEDYPGRPD